jgi:hypothetical protein
MEITILVAVALIAWWTVRNHARQKAFRAEKTTMFEIRTNGFAIHFPSMTFVDTKLAPIVYWGPLVREDGGRWTGRFAGREKSEPDTDDMANELNSQIEMAYQRFLRADVDISGKDRDWFLNQVEAYVTAQHGECHIHGRAA